MPDGDSKWELDPDMGEGAGVFLPVLRNVGILVAMSLVIAWMVSMIGDGTGVQPPAEVQGGRELAATDSPPPAGHELMIPAAANGHFLVDATANGGQVRFLIDTGASGVLLSQEDAQKAGIYPDSLIFTEKVQTANGPIAVARANLRRLRIGGLTVEDMDVWVTRSPMPISLLGMTFLNRLASYESRRDGLVLRW